MYLRDYQVPMFLPYGITTIADIHNDTAWSIAQREALKTGRMKGPRLFVSGARVTGPLGAPTTDGSYVRDAAEARAIRPNIESRWRRSHQGRPDHHRRSATGCCTQIVPGLSLHYEMQMLTDMGITPMRAIQGATLWTAEAIGQAKDLGSIEPGKLADLTIVEGNPLTDIGATRNIRTVIKGGEVVDTSYDPTWVNPVPRRPASTAR